MSLSEATEGKMEMGKIRTSLLIIVLLFALVACNVTKHGEDNRTETEKYIALVENVSKEVIGMQFKEIESKGAFTVYEQYKKLKIDVIRKSFLGEDFSFEKKQLEDAKWKLDEMTLNEDILYYVRNGTRENSFVAEFENQLVKRFILLAENELKIDASKLKIVYDN